MMYVAYYGRPGDPAGVTFWADVVDVAGGVLTAGVLDAFGNSAEYTDRFGSMTNDELIDNLYMQMFNRAADAAGKAFYVDLLTTGGSSLAEIALDIANGAQGSDLTILNNKINVAGYFTAQVAATGADYDSTDIAAAAAILAAVTADPISVVTQKIAVNDYLVDLGGVDGDADADTSGSTFSIGDSITGNDKSVLKLAVAEGGVAAFATVKDVGTVDLLAGASVGIDFNAVDWTGIGKIQLNKGVNGLYRWPQRLDLFRQRRVDFLHGRRRYFRPGRRR